MPFCHLHTHTEYSVLDGLATVDEHVAQAVNLGQTHMAITDHGNLCGANEFYRTCKKNGIEPIIGEEFYFVPDHTWRPAKGDKQPERYHVVVLAKGEAGYRQLVELSTASHRQYYYKPLLDRPLLDSLGSAGHDLVVLSGCASSIISRKIYENYEEGVEELLWWRETFPNFYIEIQHHDTAFDKKLNTRLIRVARRYDVPVVCTNDPHYTLAEDAPHHDALLAIQTTSDMDDPNRFRFDGEGYHLRSFKEMKSAFRGYPQDIVKEGLRNTFRIARECQTTIPEWENRTWHIPKYPDAEDSHEYLRSLVKKGLRRRGLRYNTDYTLRAESELAVIKQTNIADFLLITLDIITWAKSEGIPVGPGRGSVCGSLVCYLIGIHTVDPVRYNLLFERFLNPERPRMPDIDVDFGQSRRLELVEYVKKRYGEENVVAVCTYQRMNVKAAFQQLARAYGIPFNVSVRISKAMETNKDGTLDEDVEMELPEEISKNYPDLAVQLNRLAGVKRTMGTHPGGVIIGDPKDQIAKMVPQMYIPSSKKFIGQYDRDTVEATGLLKQDMLGLRTLDTVQQCLDLILEYKDEELTFADLERWWPDREPKDNQIYKMLAKGDTAGVFQMEGGVNTAGIMAIKPTEFEDIVNCTALYRTGPIQAGFPKAFHENRKAGKENIWYAHPALQPILEPTWGVILYQEQVMEIGRELAGFSMTQVDDIKEAIKKKKSTMMDDLKPVFIKGCIDNDVPEQAAESVWRQIEGYSGYAYNRSHAVAYSMLSYWTARLKFMYPLEFYCALLRTVDDKFKRFIYLQDVAKRGYRILPPCINRSDVFAIPDYSKKGIRFGFADLKGIGAKQGFKIVQGRSEGPYSEPVEVAAAVRNDGVVKVLTQSCTLRTIGVKGSPRKAEEMLGWIFIDRMAKVRPEWKRKVRLPDPRKKDCFVVGEIISITKGKTRNGDPYLTWNVRWSPHEQWTVRLWSDTQVHWDIPRGSIVAIKGRWEEQWSNISVSTSDQIKLVEVNPKTLGRG